MALKVTIQYCFILSGENEITSPNYPSDYDPNTHVCWKFTADEGKNAALTFDSMTIERTLDCIFDEVRIFNDLEGESQQGCPLCYNDGAFLPSQIVATGQEMLVTFTTDSVVQYPGFSARFESVDIHAVPVQLCQDGTHLEPIILPAGSCGDDEMYNAVQNVLNKLRALMDNDFHFLAHSLGTVGVNITTAEGVQRLACYMSDISSFEQIAALFAGDPVDIVVGQLRAMASYLKLMDTDTIRQGFLSFRKLMHWIQRTGFPHLPLRHTTYADTWQFFTELQNHIPGSFAVQVMALYSTMSANPENSLANFFTVSPEVFARACHDINNDSETLYSLFDSGYAWSDLMILNGVTMDVFADIEQLYTPFGIALIEFLSVVSERGWFDF